jgi:hypothetical protein
MSEYKENNEWWHIKNTPWIESPQFKECEYKTPPPPQAEHFQENVQLHPEVLLYYFNPNYFHVIFLNLLSYHISWT